MPELIQIGGVLCQAESPSLLRCLAGLEHGWALPAASGPGRTLEFLPLTGPPPSPSQSFSAEDQGKVHGWLQGGLPTYVLGAMCGQLRSSGQAVLWGPVEPEPPELSDLVAALLYEVLAEQDYLALHGASLLTERAGCMVVGPSGAGKSTLAYLAALAGAPYGGDDLSLLRRYNGAWHGHGTGPAVHIDSRLRRADGFAPAASRRKDKLALLPAGPHGSYVGSLAIGLIIHLRAEHPQRTAWRPMGRAEALTSLLAQTFIPLRTAWAQGALDSLLALNRLPAVELTAGSDLLEDGRAVREILEEIARESCGTA